MGKNKEKKLKKSKAAPTTPVQISPIFSTPPPKPLTLHHRSPNSDPVIQRDIAELIRPILPPLPREALHWDLLYSTDQHGMSISTMFGKAEGEGVLAVKDDEGRCFGVFLSEGLRIGKGYYGNGATFLWRVNERGGVTAYLTTGKNEYYVLSEAGSGLAFGGGEGDFGLWINDNLLDGHSSSCPTYDNEPLAGSAGKFKVAAVELWGFRH
ncbi:oxidation resistance protein 1 [Rhizophlyctis rosea]|uniref:Oxidation resistance protein 1 n=1 Tax=Rhizophlyctis rosea TaxID=64517 RepID=A0AAD5SPD4_9FUNG|nr:oxidation resistance protein 1 [Rhizophlyctis rosea]